MIDSKLIEKLAADLETYAEEYSEYSRFIAGETTKLASVKLSSDEDVTSEDKPEDKETCEHGTSVHEHCSECIEGEKPPSKKKMKKAEADFYGRLSSAVGFKRGGKNG